jgi:hypothetical protein
LGPFFTRISLSGATMMRAKIIPDVMKSRMSSTSLMAYTLVQLVLLRAHSSSYLVIALKFRLF